MHDGVDVDEHVPLMYVPWGHDAMQLMQLDCPPNGWYVFATQDKQGLVAPAIGCMYPGAQLTQVVLLWASTVWYVPVWQLKHEGDVVGVHAPDMYCPAVHAATQGRKEVVLVVLAG